MMHIRISGTFLNAFLARLLEFCIVDEEVPALCMVNDIREDNVVLVPLSLCIKDIGIKAVCHSHVHVIEEDPGKSPPYRFDVMQEIHVKWRCGNKRYF
jgi:hypothetical protein